MINAKKYLRYQVLLPRLRCSSLLGVEEKNDSSTPKPQCWTWGCSGCCSGCGRGDRDVGLLTLLEVGLCIRVTGESRERDGSMCWFRGPGPEYGRRMLKYPCLGGGRVKAGGGCLFSNFETNRRELYGRNSEYSQG